ncbi:hypothetical protein [Vibrio mexicanus]|uniref:hypothetical protein n=1 Tax=Vibrio mexicanus TaxID=1004326 RepID=UPI00063CE3AA|nr:hypothetical protein [Vibrio mexicanus]
MKKALLATAIAALSVNVIAQEASTGFPTQEASAVYAQMDLENLTRAFTDLQPEAAFMSLYHSYFDAGSTEQNIGIMETSVDPRQIVLTANSETIYAVHPVNLDA